MRADRGGLEDLGPAFQKGKIEMLKGTTTIGVKCKEGVVLASDRRASLATFIASKEARKTIQISPNAVVTISGSVADGQFLTMNLEAMARMYELDLGKSMSVESIARRLAYILWSYRPFILIAHMIVAGYDSTGAHLYNVDPLGSMSEEDFITTGSGSPISISVIEECYRPDMNLAEVKEVVVNAMLAALERDMATGNGIDLTIVDKDGPRFFSEEEAQSLIEKVKTSK